MEECCIFGRVDRPFVRLLAPLIFHGLQSYYIEGYVSDHMRSGSICRRGRFTLNGIGCKKQAILITPSYRSWVTRNALSLVDWAFKVGLVDIHDFPCSSRLWEKTTERSSKTASGFGVVGFYGISTIVSYLMPNCLYTYILNIYDLQTRFVDNIFKRTWVVVFFAHS